MATVPDLSGLSHAQKDALIAALMAQVEALTAQVAALTARVTELESKLGLPPKTPDNSSLPPSKGQKPSAPVAPKPKAQAHAGAHRPLHPNPTSRREFRAERCQRCGVDVADAPQFACQSYDRIEIPTITPDVTRVTLMGGVCPCCGKRFKAAPPADFAAIDYPVAPPPDDEVIYFDLPSPVSYDDAAPPPPMPTIATYWRDAPRARAG